MCIPLQIVFRHMDASPALESRIQKKVQGLDDLCDDLMSCRVVVEAPHQHHNKGGLYHVRIDITLPENEIVVSRDQHQNHAHEDVYVAVRDAFDAARRQLEEWMRRRRGAVKQHEAPAHGRIEELVPEQDYGRVETPDGRDIYFHRNSVVGEDFDQLQLGSEVRFTEEPGEKGPQASTVVPVGKHHILP